MNITLTKELISTSVSVVNKGRLIWVKLPEHKASFPVEIHFQESNYGKGKRELTAIEVRGHNISEWPSASGLWKRVAECISYEVKCISKQELSAAECKKIITAIKKQIRTDTIKIADSNVRDDLD